MSQRYFYRQWRIEEAIPFGAHNEILCLCKLCNRQYERAERYTDCSGIGSIALIFFDVGVDMNDRVIIVFTDLCHGRQEDLEVPLNISANDLFIALNEAYQLLPDSNQTVNNFLRCENPIALLRGNKSLKEYGLRNGSHVFFA